jgi:hypothetical protein
VVGEDRAVGLQRRMPARLDGCGVVDAHPVMHAAHDRQPVGDPTWMRSPQPQNAEAENQEGNERPLNPCLSPCSPYLPSEG